MRSIKIYLILLKAITVVVVVDDVFVVVVVNVVGFVVVVNVVLALIVVTDHIIFSCGQCSEAHRGCC